MNQIPSEKTILASKRILSQISGTKKHIVEFINTENNKDNYFCELVLRKTSKVSKVKLVLYTGILDYAAFEEIWVFDKKQHTLAVSIFHLVKNELEEVQEEYNKSMIPSTNIMPMIRNRIKEVGSKFKQKTHVPSLDMAKLLNELNGDWRESIYGSKYPELEQGNKELPMPFSGNQIDTPLIRKTYQTRKPIK